MAGYFHLAAADVECHLKRTPQITVAASDTSVKYDHSKYQEQLDKIGSDTVSPYGDKVQAHVGGLMSGEVTVSQNIRLYQENYPSLNLGCLYVDNLKIGIHINPKIYIAKDFAKDGCMYKAVMEHEQKHIQVDRMIVNKYTSIIVKGLDAALKKTGYAHGPFPAGQMQAEQKRLQDYTQGIVKAYSAQMNKERMQLQQQVDSLQEYNRVNNLCRGKR